MMVGFRKTSMSFRDRVSRGTQTKQRFSSFTFSFFFLMLSKSNKNYKWKRLHKQGTLFIRSYSKSFFFYYYTPFFFFTFTFFCFLLWRRHAFFFFPFCVLSNYSLFLWGIVSISRKTVGSIVVKPSGSQLLVNFITNTRYIKRKNKTRKNGWSRKDFLFSLRLFFHRSVIHSKDTTCRIPVMNIQACSFHLLCFTTITFSSLFCHLL